MESSRRSATNCRLKSGDSLHTCYFCIWFSETGQRVIAFFAATRRFFTTSWDMRRVVAYFVATYRFFYQIIVWWVIAFVQALGNDLSHGFLGAFFFHPFFRVLGHFSKPSPSYHSVDTIKLQFSSQNYIKYYNQAYETNFLNSHYNHIN